MSVELACKQHQPLYSLNRNVKKLYIDRNTRAIFVTFLLNQNPPIKFLSNMHYSSYSLSTILLKLSFSMAPDSNPTQITHRPEFIKPHSTQPRDLRRSHCPGNKFGRTALRPYLSILTGQPPRSSSDRRFRLVTRKFAFCVRCYTVMIVWKRGWY